MDKDMEKLIEAVRSLEARMTDLTKLMGFLVADTQNGLTNKAVVLKRLGVDYTQIADICGTTPKTISVRLAEAKRRQKKTK